ncbi:zinc finger CCCH domain-containing protein 45-like [Forsythia ovata]|uniref:Zinc finger CCCH domain-containing protein 45-like n=1 Tax=Forsythia ovata TaxID=205694 RepID=A0ABD1U5X8_9LAMI
MKELRKSTRVSSAPGANLRQVNSSLPENCPSKVCLKSILSRANVVDSKNRIVQYNASNVKPSADKLPSIFQINWKCPPKFSLKKEWCVAAGEDSECVRGQMPWEMLKPVPSAIPPRPSVSSDVEDKYYDDSHIPQIPIISIEEAAEAQLNGLAPVNSCTVSERPPVLKDQSISETPKFNLPISQKQPANEKSAVDLVHDLKDSDLVSAATAAAAVASILQTKEQGSKVDTGLLIEFLRDPKMTWKLIDENKHGANVQTGPRSGREQITLVPLPSSTEHSEPTSKETLAISRLVTERESIAMPSTKSRTPSQTASSNGKAHAGILPIYAPKPVKQVIPSWRSNSGMSLTKNLIIEPRSSPRPRINDIGGIKPVSYLIPSTSKTNMEMIKGMINKYGAQEVKPVAPLIPSTSKPNEVIEKLVNKYIGHDNAAILKSHMVASPISNLETLMESDLQTKALTGTVGRYPFPSVTKGHSAPLANDIDYCKSLIRQHGETHVNEEHKLSKIGQPRKYLQGLEFARNTKFELDLNYQMPSMYLNGPYQHPTSQPWSRPGGAVYSHVRPGGLVETPLAKRMKLE